MKLRKMLYGLTLLLGVLALNSCVNEDSACLPEDSNAKVVFSLVLPDNAQTRAEGDWSDTYTPEIGTDYDNFIDLDGIQVLVLSTDGVPPPIYIVLTGSSFRYFFRWLISRINADMYSSSLLSRIVEKKSQYIHRDLQKGICTYMPAML